ncbi:MAG TPA: SRPBCC family protein, partial [Chthoniobacteraceae bacterium]|nr:SRPBCC family protein [Chthoniobacteraceae bacterium]
MNTILQRTSAPTVQPHGEPADRTTHGRHPDGSPPEVNVSEGERRVSIAAGMGLIGLGLLRRGLRGLFLGGLGVALVRRGFSGHCAVYDRLDIHRAGFSSAGVPDNEGVKVEQSITIRRSPAEIFAFLRDPTHFPQFMTHLESVENLDAQHSRWKLKTASGRSRVWETALINHHANELLAWESVPGAEVQSAGSIRLEPAPGNRGTEVTVSLQ